MFDAIFEVFSDIGDTIGNVFDTVSETDWTDLLSSSVTPAILGAGIGALASAVTDGDMTEGLLYGAAGGLVTGGLLNFGDQFASNWSMASSPIGTMENIDFDLGEYTGGFTQADKGVIEAAGITLEAPSMQEVLNPSSGGSWWSKAGDFLTTEGGATLALGGAKFIGDLIDDTPTQEELLKEQMQAEEDRRKDRKTALGLFKTPTGPYVPSTSVPEVIRSRGLEDAEKEDMGVTLGGNTNV